MSGLVIGGHVARGFWFARAQQFAGSTAQSAAREEGSVPSRGSWSAADKRLIIERGPAPQSREDDVVRNVLDFVSHAAEPPRELDEGLTACI